MLANSTKFTVGQQVQVITTTNVRPTPSTSGTSFGTQAVGAIGTVSNVTGQGVNANGYFWWLVGFNSASCTTAASTNCGWVAESNLQAYTAPVTYTLTVSKTGTGTGAVTATCGTATCAASVNAGTVASLSATAASGSTFTGWTGTVASTNNPLSVTVNAITTETATFNTTVVTDTTAPSVPTGLTAAAVSSSQINLSWAASTDNTGGTGVGGYNIYRGTTKVGTATTNSYSDTGLTQSTAYTYTVAAYDKASPVNTSAQSTSVSATTQAQQNGSTITLTSAQAADATQVQSVINGAAGGSTIMIPNGSYTWGSQVTINGKTIRLLGAAKGGVTIANNTNCVGGVISINESTSGSVEVANLNFVPGTINPTSGCGNQYHIRVSAVSGGKPVLVHDNSFLTGYWNAIMWATSGGVIWNNTFHDQGQGLSGVEFVDRSGIHPWNAPSTLGMLDTNGVQNTYVEDNTFTDIFQAATNNDDNSRVVYRHNMFINSPLGSHGQETSTWGARQFEMYNNTLKFTTSGVSSTGLSYPLNVNFGYLIRGGTGVIFNNAMDNISSQAYGTKLLISLNVFSINRIDQIPCQTNYPAARQVGQGWIGTGGYAYGNNGGMSPPQSAPTNSVIVADGNGNTTDPIYIWGNTGSGTTGSNFVGVNQYAPDDCGNGQLVSKYVQAGRDYVLGQKPGYSPYTYPHPLRTTSSSGVGTTNIDGGTGGGTTNPTTFTITASAASNGTISPSGSVSVNSGANQIFNFAPASGYQVYSVTVDGVTTVSSALTSYTFSGVTGNHTISVAFQAVSGGGTSGNSYTTSFTSSENPISEGSKWINGGTTGTDWGNVATTPGLVYGPSLKTQYADPTAVLTGTWGPTQTAQATVKTSGVSTSCCHEVELRLRTTITAHSITGYEINCNVDGGNYVQIVRWNGPVNNFTILDSRAYGCANGDVLKATASGSTITVYKNGTQLYSVTDSTYTNGSPGVGFYDNGDTNWTSFGLSSFTASSN